MSQMPVLVYDGQCNFCKRQIARIRTMDRRDQFEYAPRDTPGLTDRFPKLAQEEFNTGMRLVMPDGQIFIGADAVYQIARRLPRVSLIAWLYRVPGLHALARAIYARIAARRQSLGSTH